jgi:hypothetical protein
MMIPRKKRRSKFRYLSKKALEGLKVTTNTVKAGGSDFTSVTKALVFLERLSCEKGIADLKEGTTDFVGPTVLKSIDKIEGERIVIRFRNTITGMAIV